MSHMDIPLLEYLNLTTEELVELFDINKINDGRSKVLLEELGGVTHLLGSLHSNPKQGISGNINEIKERKALFGENLPRIRKPINFFSLIWGCLDDLTLRILIGAAIVSLAFGIYEDPNEGWLEGAVILLAIIIVILVTSINDYIKELQFRKLNSKAEEHQITVVRDGTEQHISIFDLVVGDIAHVSAGDVMPVDAVIIHSSLLRSDESSITGETNLIKKGLKEVESPFLVSGALISEGHALVLVLAVGANSFQGKNAQLIAQQKPEETPLQKKLNRISQGIGLVGLIAAILTFLALLGYIIYSAVDNGEWGNREWKRLIHSFIIAVTIIVVAVPEGLPLAVTLSLAYSVNEMKKLNNLVRVLSASETMGQATNICSDKTGTLTQNIMKVVSLYVQDDLHDNLDRSMFSQAAIDLMIENFCHNSTATVSYIDNKKTFSGSRTEIALLDLAKEWGVDYTQERDPEIIAASVPFSSKIKRMDTVIKKDGELHVLVKGASEAILELCSQFIGKDGWIEELSSEKKESIYNEVISQFAANAQRTLTFAYKIVSEDFPLTNEDGEPNTEEIEKDLILIGIAGIQDPIRAEVPKAVDQCKSAGITVRMVTGDNRDTAMAIAKECGILRSDYQFNREDYTVLLGEEFRDLVGGLVNVDENTGELLEFATETSIKEVGNLDKFKLIAKNLRVLARSSPQDKFILVTGLRQLNEVVAVTGDGANDAPALKKSNVGFAMHIAGTQLAQEASDILLLDDNFASIVVAIKWGRNIYDCISKFIQFQLTVNIVALILSFIGACTIRIAPLTAVQMLWVNLIMDTFAALALATEPPTDELLDRMPVKPEDSLVTPDMMKLMIGQSIYQAVWLLVILFLGPDMFGITAGWDSDEYSEENAKHFTLFFNTFVFLQVFNEINCRKLKSSEINVFKGFFNNWLFLLIIVVTIVVQVVLVTYGGQPLNVSALSPEEHGYCIAIGVGGLIFGVFVRLLPTSMFRCCKISEKPLTSEEADRSSVVSFARRSASRSLEADFKITNKRLSFRIFYDDD